MPSKRRSSLFALDIDIAQQASPGTVLPEDSSSWSWCTVVFLSSGEASSASFQMLALFLVRKIPQNFTRVRLLVLSRTLVPSVLGT